MADLKKRLQKTIERYGREWTEIQPAWLGDMAGAVDSGTPGVYLARLANGRVIQVHNTFGAPPTPDLHVNIGRSKTQPKIWQIIQVVEDYDTPAAAGEITYHHKQHMFGHGDEVPVDRKQITQLTVRVSDGVNFLVAVYGGTIVTPLGIREIASQTVDLSSDLPVVGAIYASILADASGTVSVRTGTAFAAPQLGDVSYIAAPTYNEYLIGIVLLYEGQAELTDDDIVVPMPGQSGNTQTGGPRWINVLDYGATGDGSTNDTSAINVAIAALNAAGQGVLYFPAGNYLCSGALTTITAAATIQGDGMGSYDSAQNVSRVMCSSTTAVLFTVTSKYALFQSIVIENTGGTVTNGAGIQVSGAYALQRVDYDHIRVSGFYINIDVRAGYHWFMSNCVLIGAKLYELKIDNTVNPDAGGWSIVNSSFNGQTYDATAAIRIQASGGGKIANCKINTEAPTYMYDYGIDIAGSGNTSILLFTNNSIENVAINAIRAVGNFDYVVINALQVGHYFSSNSAIDLNGLDYFVIANSTLNGNSPSTAAPAITLTNCTNGFISGIISRYFTSTLSMTGCSGIELPASLSSATPQDISSTASAGSGTAASPDDHVHRGVHSLAKSGDTALYGDVTISGGTGITVTRASNNIEISATTTSSGITGIVMETGVTFPPVPLTNAEGDDWIYAS